MKKKRKGRSFWRWLLVWARHGVMAEARRKRIMRENLETWNRYNRDFIRQCEREDENKWYTTSADESSAVGNFSGDGGIV